ncbi:MAG: SCP2 sterol-binding domain-containing protein [Cocleimonas sp.]
MIVPTPLLAGIETAINAWLKLDGEALPRLAELEGKIIRFHITGLEINLFFLPNASGIQVMGNYPLEVDSGDKAEDESEEDDENNNTENKAVVDATIHGSPMALIQLSTSKNAGTTLLESDVEIDGDMHVAEKFSAILREVDIDWEELFSKLVGDIFAYRTGETVRSVTGWLKDSAEAMKLNTGEYISEESGLSPANAEVAEFMDEVDEVRMSIDRLEARINNLPAQSKNNKV